LASVTVDDVRDVVNISSAEVPDAKILKMLKRAEVTLEFELGKDRGQSHQHAFSLLLFARCSLKLKIYETKP